MKKAQKQIDLLKAIKSIMDIVRNEKRVRFYSIKVCFQYYGFDYSMYVSRDCISLLVDGHDEIHDEITEEYYRCSYKSIKTHIDNEIYVKHVINGFNGLYNFLEEVKNKNNNNNDLVKKMYNITKYKLLKDAFFANLKIMDKKDIKKFMNKNYNEKLGHYVTCHYNTKTLDKLLNII